MIIVDTALEKRHRDGNPIRVGMVGAGYMGSALAVEIETAIKGMKLVAISNRTLSKARDAYKQAGIDSVKVVETVAGLEDVVARGGYAVTDDPMLLCQAGNIDAIIDATGDIELGARVAVAALGNGKHLIEMNAEVSSTLGPILKVYADRAGVVFTYTDGDEPGVAMNLYRFVKTIGYRPLLMGQIKGFLDRYRNPETQRAFAEKNHQKPHMVASYADGTKLCIEGTLMANATGFKVGIRGMYGPQCPHVKDAAKCFSADRLLQDGGWVDYVLGSEPGTGAFVVGYTEDPIKADYLRYFKMGDGPLYVFYTPFHLPHLQLPLTVARAVLFNDATLAPLSGPVCETFAVAKRDLKAGETLDGMGGFASYGLIDTYDAVVTGNLLPMTLSEGCRLTRSIAKDQPVRYADVELPAGRLCDKLHAEQTAHFSSMVTA